MSIANSAAPADPPMLIEDDDDDIMLVEEESTLAKKTVSGPVLPSPGKTSCLPLAASGRNSITAQHGTGNLQQSSSSTTTTVPVNKSAVIRDLNSHVGKVKSAAKQAEEELALMQRSLKSMETSLGEAGEAVYEKLKFLVDNPESLVHIPVDKSGLESMIAGIVEEVFTTDLVDISTMETQSINRRLDSIENANHVVSKMFLECHAKLKSFGQSLAEESKRVNVEIAHYENILSQRTINIDDDDDDDDDVKIVDEPSAPKSLAQSSSASLKGMNMNQLRSRFASAVQTEMPGLLNTLNNQQAQAASKISTLSTPPSSTKKGSTATTTTTATATSSPSSSSLSSVQPEEQHANSTSALAALLANQSDKFVWPTLEVLDKVMGKKFNDVWYPGTILDITPPNPQDPEWRFKVRFNKGMKILPGKHVAYKEPLKCVVKVGTRVIALYKEEDAPNTMYAGIIAEAPSLKNNKRFLVFFDDGYAQYCHAQEVHKVYVQSENVWEDIHPETRSFIKDYLDIYPERPMVRLAKGQVVKTEWNGKWWTAKVIELDSSLVKMVFQSDRRTEWIYRGSTRLEPLFRALTNANAIKAAGSSRGRRHNLTMKPSNMHRKPAVEYTRGGSIDDEVTSTTGKGSSRMSRQAAAAAAAESKRKSNVAKKSTGGIAPSIGVTGKANLVPDKWEAPWIKYQRKAGGGTTSAGGQHKQQQQQQQQQPQQQQQQQNEQDQDKGRSTAKTGQSKQGQTTQDSTKKSDDIASVLQERLAHSSDTVEYDEQMETGKRRDITIDTKGKTRTQFAPHQCNRECRGDMEEVLEDPQKMKGLSPLLIPLICFWERQVCKARPNPKRYVVYRGPCGRRLRSLREVDKYLQLTDSSMGIDLFSFDHNLHVSREFVPIKTFCDIKDLSYGVENYPISCVNGVDRHYPDYVEYYNYRIPAKGVNLNLNPDFLSCCDCTDNCRDRSKCACQQLTIQNTSCGGPVDTEAGYHYRRLREPLFTGIYECNANCQCDKRCHNKVAQLGLRMRLQVFRTEKKGWGLRCLDDIAKGSFICIYAGQLLTDRGANEDGKQYGDEYLAELDFMEVVEGQKEGYESDVEFSDVEEGKEKYDDYGAGKDSDDSDFSAGNIRSTGGEKSRKSLRRNTKEKDKDKDVTKDKEKSKTDIPASGPSSVGTPISISDSDDEDDNAVEGNKNKETTASSTPKPAKQEEGKNTEVRRRAKKSTGGSRINLSYSAVSQESEKSKHKKIERQPTRSYFCDDTECYIMDAKSMGNLGRYLNHSCSPNVFVQNIFVDTHDLRFPWVAFFAGEYIRAGTELTWDYNYEVGSVPDKVLYCYCGSPMCRGRLL